MTSVDDLSFTVKLNQEEFSRAPQAACATCAVERFELLQAGAIQIILQGSPLAGGLGQKAVGPIVRGEALQR